MKSKLTWSLANISFCLLPFLPFQLLAFNKIFVKDNLNKNLQKVPKRAMSNITQAARGKVPVD